tara:strand:- start:2102 stop:2497 length:396 start_codon:yes stop_codon:yes gene_type:complete
MGILKQLFGATELIEEVGQIADNLITSKEEKLILKNQIESKILEYESNMQKEISERWKSDMESDSNLAKNVRPLIVIFLSIVFVIISFFDGNIGTFKIDDAYKPIYQTLLITVYGAYFGGRSLEKIKRNEK